MVSLLQGLNEVKSRKFFGGEKKVYVFIVNRRKERLNPFLKYLFVQLSLHPQSQSRKMGYAEHTEFFMVFR